MTGGVDHTHEGDKDVYDIDVYDVVVRGGLWFDGTGAPGVVRNLGIRDGVVAIATADELAVGPDTDVIDAHGKWLMPGFVDTHTHYDAEVLVGPGLPESVRHGVTTVLMGNCSLSTVYVNALDGADLFSRVEALPRDHVLRALESTRTWTSPCEYVEALDHMPLGPNVTAFIGHSDVRASVMGLGRSTEPAGRPTRSELAAIDDKVNEALDAGFLGVSTMTNPWDKMDGDRYRSRTLPSTHASWSEFRRLHRILRRRGRVLQAVPNLNTKYDVAFFALASTGLGRRPMKRRCWPPPIPRPSGGSTGSSARSPTPPIGSARACSVGNTCRPHSKSIPTASISWCSKSSDRVVLRYI